MNVPYCTHKKPVMFLVLIQRAGEFTLPLETTWFLSARNNWRKDLVTKRKKTWMKDATCRSSRRSVQKAKRIYHGPKIGATNLEAGLPILILWPHFWVQNLAPVLGPQNTNRSYSIRAASVLLLPQADSSTYPWYCVYIYIYIKTGCFALQRMLTGRKLTIDEGITWMIHPKPGWRHWTYLVAQTISLGKKKYQYLPSGKRLHSYEASPFFKGKSSN